MRHKAPLRRHEVRDEDGHLVAVIEVIGHSRGDSDTVELALDTGGSSYRVRLYNPAVGAARRAA